MWHYCFVRQEGVTMAAVHDRMPLSEWTAGNKCVAPAKAFPDNIQRFLGRLEASIAVLIVEALLVSGWNAWHTVKPSELLEDHEVRLVIEGNDCSITIEAGKHDVNCIPLQLDEDVGLMLLAIRHNDETTLACGQIFVLGFEAHYSDHAQNAALM